jgi:hypothetical protein
VENISILKVPKGICLILACLSLAACSFPDDTSPQKDKSQQPPIASDGVLDLRDWDYEQNGSIDLAGQ